MQGYQQATGNEYPVITWNRLDAAGLNQVYLDMIHGLRNVRARIFNAAIRAEPHDFLLTQFTARMRDDEETADLVICKLYDDPIVRAETIIHSSEEPVIVFLTIGTLYGQYLERRTRG